MAEQETQSKAISKNNAGFPEWLDFDKMRQQGIDYLGELSGNIWTDHNVHDPGITILEVLCYALLDLGYRTSLPAKDLFAKDPRDTSPENNFLTPAAILGCNPVTVTDYRKLLIDVPGVKNAWLVPAEDITLSSICREQKYKNENERIAWARINNRDCLTFLNGLYHVYLDIEPGVQYKKDLPANNKERTIEDVVADVRKLLMAHRNLCEDFFDIIILCKQKIGVCADVTLRADADPEKVFVKLIEKIREFLSPAPRFYRLKQLLEKGKSIEEIFEGRPIDLEQSHGFVDVDEFEKITLQKEIHISDLYNALFSVEGVAAVKSVKLRNSDGSVCLEPGQTSWIFKLYENHVPELDLLSSGFTFSGSRGNLVMDTRKFSKYLEANPYTDGKALMFPPSANLDVLLEQGNYRATLADYYPIENDFPKVYGITEGSLPDDVSPQRKSQALQLRAYLLFFDTMLSGYLSQLKNIRGLFALTSPGTEGQHTYFINKMTDRPGLEQLVPFSLAETQPYPSDLAFPVCKKELEDVQASGKVDWCTGEGEFAPYTFCSMAERDVAIRQLIEDLQNENFTDYVFANKSGCWSYYFVTSSETFAIVGKEFYQRKSDAQNAASTLRYLCTHEKSFRRYTTLDKKGFSFHVVSSVDGYWNYLSLLAENEKLYHQRRNGFLDHLLARFAETFSDYALLSYSFLNDGALQQHNIRNKEKFLSAYPQLSSMRGKGYDYLRNGWNNDNVSGVEKRFEAYAGIGSGRQEYMCHFEVAEFEEQTVVNIKWSGKDVMASNTSFPSREEGIEALNAFLKASADPANYMYAKAKLEDRYEVTVQAGGNVFHYPTTFENEAMATEAGARLQRMFSTAPAEADIEPSQFEHTLVVNGQDNQWTKKDPVVDRQPTFIPSADALANFGDTTQWIPEKTTDRQTSITFNNNPDKPDELIDISAFEPYENRVDVRKNITIYKYTVSDRERTFFFMSEQEYESETDAHENMLRLLFRLADQKNYQVSKISDSESVLHIVADDRVLATNTIEFADDAGAKAAIDLIVAYVRQHRYQLAVNTTSVRWKFALDIALPDTGKLRFTSGTTEYSDRSQALAEASRITAPSEDIHATLNKNNVLELKDKKHPQKIVAQAEIPPDTDPKVAADLAEHFLSFKKTVGNILDNPRSAEAQRMVVPDSISRQGNFGYRLVQKDGYQAWYDVEGKFDAPVSRAKKITEIYRQYGSEENYLQLLYGDGMVMERKDPGTQATKHHFRLITRQTDDEPNGIVLFESVKGYNTAAEAQKAFDQQYVRILTFASDESYYGKWISYEETFSYTSGNCDTKEAQVFIPAETMKRFGLNNDHARQQLAALSATFPVRRMLESDPRFADYFLCGEKPTDDPDDICCDKEETELYFFTYKHKGDNGAWISQSYFTTVKDAMRQFNFFLMLLRYKGNYSIHKNECDCRWRLSVREILAESKRRFPTADEAWGREGVEKFICTSQSNDAFPLYQREDDCGFSFFVACSTMGLIHPCTYDTVTGRDEALQRLYTASRHLLENRKKKDGAGEWEEMITVLDNRENAKESHCERAIELIERFLKEGRVEKIEPLDISGLKPYAPDQEKALSPYERMKWFAHYFPVRRRKLETSGTEYRYYLHINLPGFYEAHPKDPDPCGCDPDLDCCTPWISECCFTTCEEALRHYYKVMKCLAEKEHYYPVMDCECNHYGIRFYCDCGTDDQPNPNEPRPNQPRVDTPERQMDCCSEIIAFNPQSYTTPAMACEAIARAKRFINAEGLHLVEHILLRPHCREGDCRCLIESCLPDTCQEDFKWRLPDDDPCAEGRSYCFVPGADPYSFVTTVVLPAWPERFRKKENRQRVEMLLYREMPAHIMTRILWLTPQDLCRFESLYRQWTKWLALKPVCTDGQPACSLIDFLFKSDFHCFDCDECQPCAPPSSNDPCQFSKEYEADPNAYVNAINALYCWNTICPQPAPTQDQVEQLKSKPQLKRLQPSPLKKAPAKKVQRQLEKVKREAPAKESLEKKPTEKKTIEKPTEVLKPPSDQPEPIEIKEPLQPDAEPAAEENREEAERKIDARFYGYKEEARAVMESSGNVNAELAVSFLNQSLPNFEAYHRVVEAVVANKRSPDNRRLLSANEKTALVQTLTWYYLDRNVLRRRVSDNEAELKDLFQKLGKKGLLPEFKKWKSRELTRVEPEAPINEVKKLLDKS